MMDSVALDKASAKCIQMFKCNVYNHRRARNILKGGICKNLSTYYISFQMHVLILKLPKQVACQNVSGLINS